MILDASLFVASSQTRPSIGLVNIASVDFSKMCAFDKQHNTEVGSLFSVLFYVSTEITLILFQEKR